MADGTLDEASFRYYIAQDSLYLRCLVPVPPCSTTGTCTRPCSDSRPPPLLVCAMLCMPAGGAWLSPRAEKPAPHIMPFLSTHCWRCLDPDTLQSHHCHHHHHTHLQAREYARALALVASKAPRPDWTAFFCKCSQGAYEVESGFHEVRCEGWLPGCGVLQEAGGTAGHASNAGREDSPLGSILALSSRCDVDLSWRPSPAPPVGRPRPRRHLWSGTSPAPHLPPHHAQQPL